VLIYDGTGRHPGPLAAEQARQAGAEVIYVSIDAQLSEELTYAERLRWKKRFLQIGVKPIFGAPGKLACSSRCKSGLGKG